MNSRVTAPTMPYPGRLPKKIHRIAVGTLFFLLGLCFASWASRIPDIQQKLHLSEAGLGAVLFALPVGSMVSLPFSGLLVSRAGSRKIALIAAILYAIVLVSVGLSFTVYYLVVSLFAFGFAGNMMNIAVNTQAVSVEALYSKSIMASFHGLWSLAGFTGAAVGTFMIGAGINPFHHFIVILILVIIGVISSSRYIIRDAAGSHPDQPLFARPDKTLLNLGIIAFCSMVCEGAMFDWSGVYFRKIVMAEKAWIGAGYTAFMGTMASGRFVADWFTSRFGFKRTLQVSGSLTTAGLLIAVLFPHLLTAIIGFLLVGAGVSSVVPLIYGAAGRSKTLSPGVALAAVSTIGFLGFLIGPPLIGLVAAVSSLRISFTIIAIMGLFVVILSSKLKVK